MSESAPQHELSVRDERAPAPEIPVFRGGNGVRPGVDLSSNRAIYEFLDEGVELDQRR